MRIFRFFLGVLGQVLLEILIASSWGGPPTSTNLCNGDVKSQTGQAAGPNAGWPVRAWRWAQLWGLSQSFRPGDGQVWVVSSIKPYMHSRIHLTASQQLILVINHRGTLGPTPLQGHMVHSNEACGSLAVQSFLAVRLSFCFWMILNMKKFTQLSDDDIRNISVYQRIFPFAGLLLFDAMFQSFSTVFSSTTTQAYLNCFWTCFWDFFGHWSWFMILDSFSTPYQRHPASDSQHIRRRVSGPKPISQLQVQLRPELDGSWNGTPTGHWIPLKDGEKYGNRIAKMGFPKIGKDWEHMGHIFSKLPNQCDFGYFGVPNVDTTVIVHVADGGGAQAQLGERTVQFWCQNSIFPLGNSLGIQRKSHVFQAAEVNPIYWLVVSTCFLISGL